MFEIYAAAMFDTFFSLKGPGIDLFHRFKSQWGFLNKSNFHSLDSDEVGESCLNTAEKAWFESRWSVVVFNLQQHLKNVQPRDDYREFARLTLQMLGDDVEIAAGFSAPGAYHRARWMAKGIHCLKMFGFHHQFCMSKREIDSLRRICLFVCTIYTNFWFNYSTLSNRCSCE